MATGKSLPVIPAATPAGNERFQDQADRVLAELRDAFAQILAVVPGRARRAVDLQRALGVDAPLAWRIFRVAIADDPLLIAQYVPTRGQLQTLLEALGQRAPTTACQRVRQAIDGYEEFRREHAGDRETLDAMIGALRPGATSQIDEKTRRTAFKQMARIWGLQVQTAARALILYPGSEPGAPLGGAVITALIGLHAVRPDVPLVVHATARFKADARAAESGPGAYRAEDRSGLLLEFSSPGVEYRTEVGEDETVATRICSPGIGRRAAVNTFALAVAKVASDPADRVALNSMMFTPAELCHLELLVPVGLTDPRTARMSVYGRRSRVDRVFERRATDLLPMHEPVVHLGAIELVPPLAGVPRWPEVVRHVLSEVGAYGTRFDAYRCRVPYPVLHTLVSVQADPRGRTTEPPGSTDG